MQLTEVETDDVLYTIATILFVLSLISERLANLIKLNWGRLRTRRISPSLEKIREQEVTWLSVACGWIVAILAGADLFHLLADGKLISIFEPSLYENDEYGKALVGVFLSGLFISLGSKFWHDVLDIVLQFSTLKKFKATEASVSGPVVAEARKEELGLIVAKNLDEFKKIPGYIAHDYVSDSQGNPSVIWQFKDAIPQADADRIKTAFSNRNVKIESYTSVPRLQ